MEQKARMKNPIDRVWQVVEKAGICMFVSCSDDTVRARPLEARPNREENAIYFLIDARGTKDDEIAVHPEICLVFIDPEEKVYLSISGAAQCRRDTTKAKELWNREQFAWWPAGPSDDNVRVMRVKPEFAEFWDGPASRETVKYEFAVALSTGKQPNLGENRKIKVAME